LISIETENAVLRTFILFVQTAQALLKYADASLYKGARLSVVKLIVLKALDVNNGVLSPSKLAEWTQTERNNITTLVKRMQKDGLITAERNSSDKRSVDIILTDKGRELLRQVMPVAQDIIDRVMSSMTEVDIALLEKQLKTLRQDIYTALGQSAFSVRKWPE